MDRNCYLYFFYHNKSIYFHSGSVSGNDASTYTFYASSITEDFCNPFELDSGEVVISSFPTEHSGQERQEVALFSDEVRGQTLDIVTASEVYSNDGAGASITLGDFLKRPVRIYSDTWLESETAGSLIGTFNPWYSFFNDSRIKNKLHNYSFIRCTLKVKIIINASPFYYGAAMSTYCPLQSFNGNVIPLSATTNQLIPYSQRPHVWLYPTNSQGGEMTLPFFWPFNWLRVGQAADFIDMGRVDIFSYTDLRQANGVTGTGISYQVFAWAEDVELAGATAGLALQSGEMELDAGDEYDGLVSGPASAVAAAAGSMSKIPVIGKFATAAQVGATAVAKISSLFGYTNLPNIKAADAFRSAPFPQMASGEISYPTEPLGLDPKIGLSVDPSLAGLEKVDELDIMRFTSRESYLTSTAWTMSDAVDKILFYSGICPSYFFNTEAITGGKQVWFTPTSYMAELFNCWRGDVVFRFRVIASQYHKGRLRISWDPTGDAGNNIVGDVSTITAVQTLIIDIGKDSDVEFRVPFNQARGWLRLNSSKTSVPWSTNASPIWSNDDSQQNGCLTMRVQNTLTGPTSTGTVTVLVSVRGENLEFANPGQTQYQKYSPFELQSGQVEEAFLNGDAPLRYDAGAINTPLGTSYLVNFGEKITSARELVRRPVLHRVSWYPDNTTQDKFILSEGFSKLPLYPGYDPHGINSFKGVNATTTNFAFNCVNYTPMSWLNNCFVAMRGGTTWILNADAGSVQTSVRVIRKPTVSNTSPFTITTAGAIVGTASANARLFIAAEQGLGGFALTNQRTQDGISVFCPQYNNVKFISTKPGNVSYPTSYDSSSYESYLVERSYTSKHTGAGVANTLWWYTAAGHDYVPLFFLNAPCLYLITGDYPVAN